MNMSFMLTRQQILDQTKTVTRRLGWRKLKPGDILQPVYKCQGLKKGEKVGPLGCKIEVVSVNFEVLSDLLYLYEAIQELYDEGVPNLTPIEFCDMFCKANKCSMDAEVTRIGFKYLALLPE